MAHLLSRRWMLRSALTGAGVVVGLPLLDCFLDGNGTALASGAPVPVRFGTWHWGLGVNPDRFYPKKIGAGYDVQAEFKPLEPYKDQITVLSGFNAMLDGRPNLPHQAALWTLRSGTAPEKSTGDAPSFDT